MIVALPGLFSYCFWIIGNDSTLSKTERTNEEKLQKKYRLGMVRTKLFEFNILAVFIFLCFQIILFPQIILTFYTSGVCSV